MPLRTLAFWRAGLVLALVALWGLALGEWSELPQRVPVHFDAAGRPDAFAPKGVVAWFAVPVLGSGLGLLLGCVLPRFLLRAARRNSPFLNVPNKQRFRMLPVAARERAVAAPLPWLLAMAVVLQILFAWLVHGSARVAHGEWQVLPPGPTFVLVSAVVLLAIVLAVSGSRAVRRELAASG